MFFISIIGGSIVLHVRSLNLVHFELLRQKLSCTGSQFASCAKGMISLRIVALERL